MVINLKWCIQEKSNYLFHVLKKNFTEGSHVYPNLYMNDNFCDNTNLDLEIINQNMLAEKHLVIPFVITMSEK